MLILNYNKKTEKTTEVTKKPITVLNVDRDSKDVITVYTDSGFYITLTETDWDRIKNPTNVEKENEEYVHRTWQPHARFNIPK